MAASIPTEVVREVEENNAKRHRTLIVLLGIGTKNYIPVLHEKLNKITSLSSILWCYKNSETGADSVVKKYKQDLSDTQLVQWLKMNTPEHILYKESHKILGRTCDMLILQDFEMLTPNILVTAIETVRGGGVIVLLLDQAKTLSQIVEIENQLHVNAAGSKIVPLFNRRLFKSLGSNENVIFLDDHLRLINVSKEKRKNEIIQQKSKREKEPTILQKFKTSTDLLIDLCQTDDQAKGLKECISVISSPSIDTTLVMTSPRGRGKTALLGLTAAYAMYSQGVSLGIVALYPENIQTFFEHLIVGLSTLGWIKQKDFQITYTFYGKKRLIKRIVKSNIHATYFSPDDSQCLRSSLLFIDEAASIPVNTFKRLLSVENLFISTTLGGYEGTGRTFQTRLLEHLKKERSTLPSSQLEIPFRHIKLKEPIRYNFGDPIENWLDKVLIVNPMVRPIKDVPLPSDTILYHLNKSALFSLSDATEIVLQELLAIFASSHYKNTPNDLQILADCTNHEVLVLSNKKGRILAAIQIAIEGPLDFKVTKREGNLIPWVIYENFGCKDFASLEGARIVRIATHPTLLSMGYGSELLRRVEEALSSSDSLLINPQELVLFNPSCNLPSISWIGSSFGLTEQLYRFWKRSKYYAVCIKQRASSATGEYSTIVLKECDKFSKLFRERLMTLLSYSFRSFSPSLCLSLFYSSSDSEYKSNKRLSEEAVARLNNFSKGLFSVESIIDLLPDLSAIFFASPSKFNVPVLQQAILVMIGCQHHTPEYISKSISLEFYQVESSLRKTINEILKVLTSISD